MNLEVADSIPNKEIDHSKYKPVVRAMVFASLHPELVDLDSGSGVLRWFLEIKSKESMSRGMAEFPGGHIETRNGQFETLEAGGLRETGEELGIWSAVKTEELFKDIYMMIPDYVRAANPRNKTGFVGIEALSLDKPFPVKPEEAKVEEVVALASEQMKGFLTDGQVVIQQADGSERTIKGMEYCCIGTDNQYYEDQGERQKLHQILVDYIDSQEASHLEIFKQQQGKKELVIHQVKGYLKNFDEDDARLMPALLYGMYGWGGESNLTVKDVDRVLEGLNPVASKKVKEFFKVLEWSFKGLDPEKVEDANKYEQRLAFYCKAMKLISWKTNLTGAYREAGRLLEAVGQSLTKMGVPRGYDVDLTNEVKNEGFINIFLMATRGCMMMGGQEVMVDDKARYDAAKVLGLTYSIMSLREEYENLYKKRNIQATTLFNQNFEKTQETIQINDEQAAIRKYVTKDKMELAVVEDKANVKSISSYVIKVLLGYNRGEVGDIYRRSVVIVGIWKNGKVEEFKKVKQRNYYANVLANELAEKAKKNGLIFGSRQGREGDVENNLEGRPKGHRDGSIGGNFKWIKGYLSSVGENQEISELAIWSSLEDSGKGFWKGFATKKRDDQFYALWRLANIFGWFYPQSIYGSIEAKKLFKQR